MDSTALPPAPDEEQRTPTAIEPRPITGRPFVKGDARCNRTGRPKGVAALAREIQRRTGDGEKMIRFAENIWLNRAQDDDCEPLVDAKGAFVKGGYDDAQRWSAFTWLGERGWGKPISMVDVQAMVAQFSGEEESAAALPADVDALDDEDLDALEAIALKRLGVARKAARPVLEAAAVEVRPVAPTPTVEIAEPEPIDEPPPAPREPRYYEASSSNVTRALLAPNDASPSGWVLEVEFRSGARWQYANVTEPQFDAWLVSPSAGAWLAREIVKRPDRHPARKLLGEVATGGYERGGSVL
jgi:hypothetical protein